MSVNQTISPISTAPVLGVDSKEVFIQKAETVWAELKTAIPQLNTAFEQINTTETSINTKEASASSSATSAAASSLSAQGSANYQGAWTSKGYTLGQTVSDANGIRWLCKLTHTTAQTATEGTYWTIAIPYVGAIGNINSPLLDMPLKNSLAMKAGVGSATFTRASTATYIDRYGVLKTAAIDEPRFEKEGYLNEGASTNLALYSADLSNVAWVKTNGTALKDATGWDGVASSASTFTATSTDATVLQSVTLSSAERTYSLAIKRKTGIGTISITQDGGTTWTDVTNLINSTNFVRLQLKQTVLNPVFGVKISVSGDAVYIDANQLEAMPFATSYIPTGASTVTRSADILSVTPTYNFPLNEGSIAVDFDTIGIHTSDQRVLQYHTGTSNVTSYSLGTNGGNNAWESYTEGNVATLGTTILQPNIKYRLCSTGSKTSLQKRYVNGVLMNAPASTYWQTTLGTTLSIGSLNGTTAFLYGHISNVRMFDKALTPQEVALC